MALRGDLHLLVARKLKGMQDVRLSQLDLLQSELDVLGRSIAVEVEVLCVNQLLQLDDILRSMVFDLICAHVQVDGTRFSLHPLQTLIQAFASETSSSESKLHGLDDHHFQDIAKMYLLPVAEYLETSSHVDVNKWRVAARAWACFSMAGILLYVPDRSFDPALRPSIERQFFNQHRASLEVKLNSLRNFDVVFTGQSTNLRSRIIQDELRDLGTEPPVPDIVRPPLSMLDQLQGEFNNLLRVKDTIANAVITEDDSLLQDATVGHNVSQLVERLSSDQLRAYEDISGPAVGFLQCLRMGLTIAQTQHDQKPSRALLELDMMYGNLMHTSPSSEGTALLEYSPSTVYLGTSGSDLQVKTHQLFGFLFHAWQKEVRSEQEHAAAQSSLYTYRGDQNQEEEITETEYQELFPDYHQTGQQDAQASDGLSPREMAIRISDLHTTAYLDYANPLLKFLTLQERAAKTLSSVSDTDPVFHRKADIGVSLPGMFLSLQRAIQSITPTTDGSRNYNIYVDSNVAEARKLVLLIHKVQQRFRQIQEHDDCRDHATPKEILSICGELLAFRHIEPVAKFLTKGEKLHESIHEWQRVASRDVSAGPLYDELTNLLISWRQLELTTWARLFDLEMEKCIEDAKSWWPIAYENIIAATESVTPDTLNTDGEVERHAQELLRTLEGFLSAATLGQFQQRLSTLEQFHKHLATLASDVPAMACIGKALGNFHRYFARFEPAVQDMLSKGRQGLEKDVQNVLQMSSWRDRTIDALRQSAKTSHRNLFKLVRKFRGLLNQPVEPILRQGLPDVVVSEQALPMSLPDARDTASDPEALRICESLERPPLFNNVSAIVSVMRRKNAVIDSAVDAPHYIEGFLANLEASMTHLQKVTPSVLTKENRDHVKYLKSRKRRLFADVLKELRQMGFKPNLGGDSLAKQSSLAIVLAAVPTLPSGTQVDFDGAEFYLHKTLSLMPDVREASRNHSDDLTSAEVARSIGYLESLLQTVIRQRNVLARILLDTKSLKEMVDLVEALWAPGEYTAMPSLAADEAENAELRSRAELLRDILGTGARIIEAQAEIGKFQAPAVIQALRSWSGSLGRLISDIQSLPKLPMGLCTDVQKQLSHQMADAFERCRIDLLRWSVEAPLHGCVLRRIIPWTEITFADTSGIANGHVTLEVEGLKNKLFGALELTLGSMQDFEKTAATLPHSTDDETWLLREDASLAGLLTSLHSRRIHSSLKSVLNEVHHLDISNSNVLQLATALFATVLPIIRQYFAIVQDTAARYARYHSALGKLAYRLSKSFIQIGTRGFCTPSEKSDDKNNQTEKLESGTGLGEGEGAEDISKDIQNDEDLSELAQEPNTKPDKEKIENEKDAVDMADQEMEGEMDDVSEQGEDDQDAASEEEGNRDELEEEAGEVDDLGPSAVDEKMWNDDETAEKDKEGDQGKGTTKADEQVAGQEQEGQTKKEEEDVSADEMDTGADEFEALGREEMEKTDPHLQEAETLDLPDELDMDNNRSQHSEMDSLEDEDLGDMNDPHQQDAEEAEEQADTALQPEEPVEGAPEDDVISETEAIPQETCEAPAAETDAMEQGAVEDDADETDEAQVEDGHLQEQYDDDAHAAEDTAVSDVRGIGNDADDQAEVQSENAARQEQGTEGGTSNQEQSDPTEAGSDPDTSRKRGVGRSDEEQESAESQAFKKLGDTLERWYNQQRQIHDASEHDEGQVEQAPEDVDMADADFEHLRDDGTKTDAQALGAASEEQARALDESMGVRSDESERNADGDQQDEQTRPTIDNVDEDVQVHDSEPALDSQTETQAGREPNAFVGASKDLLQQQPTPDATADAPSESNVEEVDSHMSTIRISPASSDPLSAEEARRLWTHHEASTRTLSLSLTEHLRLILAPTLATKMRGDFRTGKRLNIKRIIPYIASQYKRDKIWMRRSVPSKRAYQIMIALDDSRSMAESGSAGLALETVALVAKSLAMLEVGSICVAGFGEDVQIVHEFEAPFTSDAGVNVFRQFGFQQTKTDVRRLVGESVKLFREARLKASGSGAELWQLQIVISDGVCEDHATIQRLVRQAQEERIMIVFVIMDASKRSAAGNGVKGQSIVDLETAEFGPDDRGEMKLVRRKYLDTFPFRWYLVVRDVKELPGVLATALRQWFAEVVDTAG